MSWIVSTTVAQLIPQAISGVDDKPVSIEERGFLIYNPKGILTAFVDPQYP